VREHDRALPPAMAVAAKQVAYFGWFTHRRRDAWRCLDGAGCTHLNVISENARILGKVKAEHVIIQILCVGSIECDDLLELQPDAPTFDKVRVGIVRMQHGIRSNGELRYLEATQRQTLTIAASNDRSATVDIPIEAQLCPTKETP